MGHTRKIAVATESRAERGILEPVIRRLELLAAEGKIEFDVIEWNQKTETAHLGCDVILIPADRAEMTRLAMDCFYIGIPVFHLWAGIGHTGTWDDVNRRVISTYSYLMLCEDEECRQRLVRDGEEAWRCIVTGTPHYDDMETDLSLVPPDPYDLVLINPNPVDPVDQATTMANAARLLDKDTVWVGPSGDLTWSMPLGFKHEYTYFADLPRPRFLGLLSKCRRFISNSSAAVYEAPYFHVDVVNPGNRNMIRTTHAEMKPGAADRIVRLLVGYPIDRTKLLKRYE